MKQIDTRFYPGWTRKAITFTIDDGNIPMDRKFLDIVRPAGIRGTFNLCSHSANQLTPEQYREFYRDYEIANHCKYHPFALSDGETPEIAADPFDPETADPAKLYPTSTEHLYNIKKPQGWRMTADTEGYIAFIDACQDELERIFGQGSVRSYVWPFDQQNNNAVLAHLRSMEKIGYYGVRRSGAKGAESGFPLPKPEERWPWHYTATHRDLLEKADAYEALPDDGELKFFCIGVHSIDYEKAEKWEDLRTFAARFGKDPGFWSAPVGEIFNYADALSQLRQEDGCLENPTDTTLYIRIDGENVILAPHGKINL